jgi:hypothetical protein
MHSFFWEGLAHGVNDVELGIYDSTIYNRSSITASDIEIHI